ncbi:YbaK/EbsC family protein [bacterium]|nr:YbaK/EbsC family protein [bacterium]
MSKNKQIKQKKAPAKIINYLEKIGISHEILEHKTVYTAIDVANTLKKKLNQIVKSLVVKADHDYYLVLLPADKNLDEEKLKKIIGKQKGKEIKTVKIPGEKIMQNALKIKQGALSAFGKAHKLPVIIDKELEKVKKAVFSTGGLNHSVEMRVRDFIASEEAILGNLGIRKKIKSQKKTPPKRKRVIPKIGVKKNIKTKANKKIVKKPVKKNIKKKK